MENQLKTAYRGKELILRNFFCDQHLVFAADGRLRNPSDQEGPSSWTVCGIVRLNKFLFLSDRVVLDGERVPYVYSAFHKKMIPYSMAVKQLGQLDKSKKDLKDLKARNEVRIEIEYPGPNISADSARRIFQTVFSSEKKELIDMVPPYWKSWLVDETSVQIHPIPCTPESGDIIYDLNYGDSTHLGSRLVSPEVISRAEPIYTEPARMAKWQGTVIFAIIVDKGGDAQVERIIRPIGLGLDDVAIKGLQQWKFSPARLDGSPVSMRLKVEVHYSMR